MKILLFVVGLLLSSATLAQTICRAYEYAELKDMPQTKLSEMYCYYGQSIKVMLDLAIAEIKSGRVGSSQRAENEANRCSQEQDRVERLLSTKPVCIEKQSGR